MLDLNPVIVPSDYDPSQHPLPVVNPIEAEAASDNDLEQKIKEYHEKSPFLAAHANWQQDRLRVSKGRFERVTESVVMLQTLLEAAEAVAPNQELFVEQELFSVSADAATAISIGTISASGLSLVMSIWAMTRAVPEAGVLAQNASRFAKFKHTMKSANVVKATRILGGVGAVVSLGTGIASFVISGENDRRRRAYLVSLTNDYRARFDSTTANHNVFESARDELEAEIAALQAELGFPEGEAGYDAMVAALAGNIQKLGALTARLTSLLRLLCQQKDVAEGQRLTDAEIAGIISLTDATVAILRAAINDDPSLCNSVLAA